MPGIPLGRAATEPAVSHAPPGRAGTAGSVAAWVAGLLLLGVAMYAAPATGARLLIIVCIGAAGLWAIWKHLGVGLAGMLLATSSLIPRGRFTLGAAGLRLDLADMTIIALLAVILLQLLQGRRFATLERAARPIAVLLLLFAGGAVLSAAYARLELHVNLGIVLGELRPAVYCAACAVVAIAAVRRGELPGLIIGLFIVADLTALAVILGQFSASVRGVLPVPPEGVWQINQVGSAAGGFGAVRLVPPAHVLMYLMANIAFCLLLGPLQRPRLRLAITLQFMMLIVALVLTYTRAQWIASLIAMLLACILAPRPAQRRLSRALLLIVPVCCLAIGAIGSGLLSPGSGGPAGALATRAGSIFKPSDTLGSASLQWRTYEDGAAIASIRAHPLLGVGLGNNYRNRTLLQGEASGWLYPLVGTSSLTRFAHNGYLYLAVKTGLPIFAVFIGFCLAFLLGGVRLYRRTAATQQRLIVLACLCSFAGVLEWAFFEPHFMLAASMATVGVAAGIVMAGGNVTQRVLSSAERARAGGWLP
jgi:hypothetical protein